MSLDYSEPLITGRRPSIRDVARAYLPLPFIAFGGPQAHIGLMFERFVSRKRWLSERLFAELLAISNALPGPASTQLAFTIALIRAGPLAAIVAFLIWSIPGAIVMGSLGYSLSRFGSNAIPAPVLQVENGLACVAVALVAIAALKLGSKILGDNPARLIATGSACALILFPAEIWLIPAVLALGGALRYVVECCFGDRPRASTVEDSNAESVEDGLKSGDEQVHLAYSRRTGLLLVGGTVLATFVCGWIRTWDAIGIHSRLFATFFLVGALIFGGGPVVVPMLYSYVVGAGWMSSSEFLLGLAVINCMPGPNFNFAAFCGALALRSSPLQSAIGALLAWLGIFSPGLAIKAGVLPLWRDHRHLKPVEILFRGFNAVAVGFMFSAVYLLWEKAVVGNLFGSSIGAYPGLVATTAVSFVLLEYLKAPIPGVLAFAGLSSLLGSQLS